MPLALLRRIVLAGSGATFAIIAALAVVFPHQVAARYGMHLDFETMNEFRAVFMGFWIGLAAMMITAAKRPEETLLGDLCGLALLLQTGGRLVSVCLDGVPQLPLLLAMIGEAIAGAIVLVGRRTSLG